MPVYVGGPVAVAPRWRWRGAYASLSEEGPKDMQAGPPRKGRLDESGVPGYVGGPVAMAGRLCVTLGGRSKGNAGGPAAAAGRSCVSLGR